MVVEHIRRDLRLPDEVEPVYSSTRTAERHRTLIRERSEVVYDPAARKVAAEAIEEAARRMNNPADLINIALERLGEGSFELPAFRTLNDMTTEIRARVNGKIFARVVARHFRKDRAAMLAMVGALDLRATSADTAVLDLLDYVREHAMLTRDHIADHVGVCDANGTPVLGKDGKQRVEMFDTSFASDNWNKAIRDRKHPGMFVRRHLEACVLTYLALAGRVAAPRAQLGLAPPGGGARDADDGAGLGMVVWQGRDNLAVHGRWHDGASL